MTNLRDAETGVKYTAAQHALISMREAEQAALIRFVLNPSVDIEKQLRDAQGATRTAEATHLDALIDFLSAVWYANQLPSDDRIERLEKTSADLLERSKDLLDRVQLLAARLERHAGRLDTHGTRLDVLDQHIPPAGKGRKL